VPGYAQGVVVAIAGAHGQIARHLTRRLAADGNEVIGLIRNPDHADDVTGDGASAVVCDLEHAPAGELAEAIRGAEAAVFAAGAGPGSGAERKLTMDRDGAIKLVQAAAAAEVPRFVIVSSVGAENPPDGDDAFSIYVRAKAEADEAVMASDREWTILRPGRLTNDPGSGRVRLDLDPFRGEVPREDVAAVIAQVLPDSRFAGKVLYVNGGEVPVERALEAIL
jgi:nucleoside-diphosphate-sugar epimerase